MSETLLKLVRLNQDELLSIQQSFRATFLPADHLWLFGSRANMNKRGGDIDLYIETNVTDLADVSTRENQFIFKLWDLMGEKKIDVVINILPANKDLPIYSIAKNTGIQLI